MHVIKNLIRIPFWMCYFTEDYWIRKKLAKINTHETDYTKEEMFLQRKLLAYCKRAFPEYYKHYGLTGREPIEGYPILSKADLREHPEWFRSRYRRWIPVSRFSTSGSTGTPFAFWISPNHDAVHQRMLWDLMGYEKGDKILSINGRTMRGEDIKKNIFYKELSHKQLPYGGYVLSCLYLSEYTAPCYFQYLEQLKPQFIRGYSHAVYRLAQYADTHGLEVGCDLKGIQVTSELIFEYQIRLIERVFHTRVYMQYGHAEACVFAYTGKEDHRYRCSPLYGHVEVLDEDGNHVKEGETGEVVVTSYSNYAMPFIRYRTGDMVEYGGREGAVVILNRVQGRVQNLIYNKEGEPISITSFITKTAYSHMLRWRIVQREYGKILLRIVKGPGYSTADEEDFREAYERNGRIEVEFEYVEDLELSQSGKAVLVEQHLSGIRAG